MDKSDIFTAELILIFSLVIDISRYFHCRVWITSDVSIHLTSLNVPHFRNSNAYNSVIYERKHNVWVFIFIAPAYSRVRYRSPNFCPSVRSFVRPFGRPSVRQHLRRSLTFTSKFLFSLH